MKNESDIQFTTWLIRKSDVLNFDHLLNTFYETIFGVKMIFIFIKIEIEFKNFLSNKFVLIICK